MTEEENPFFALQLDREAMREHGITEEIIRVLHRYTAPDRELALELLPHLKDKKDPTSQMALYDATRAIVTHRQNALKEIVGGLQIAFKITDNMRAENEKLRAENARVVDDANKILAEKTQVEGELRQARADTKLAAERSGVFATQDKHDLEVAQAQVKELKGQLQGIVLTMKGQLAASEEKDRAIEGLKTRAREADEHSMAALERLQDRFPVPTPFFSTIIDELLKAKSLLTT